MATFRPASFPRRPKQSNLYAEAKYHLQLSYFRYEINTGQYVMSPGEKFAFNTITFSILLLLFLAVFYYLPTTTFMGLRRLAYYFTGQHRLHMSTVDFVQGVIPGSGDAVASLVDHGTLMNASGSVLIP